MMRHFRQRIHCVGIGGAGMSGLAELLHCCGHTVTGSDRAQSDAANRLKSLGINVQAGHTPDLVKDAQLLIYSSAIRTDNPERVYAREHHIAELRRADALGQIMQSFTTVCIAGTHGKTTTTALVGAIMAEAKLKPTVLVGGTLRAQDAPVIVGESALMVAEADEFDRSFLAMYPTVAVITNIEADHLDCYTDLDDIKDAFAAFAGRVPFYGAIVCCSDDKGVRDIMPRFERKRVTYGICPGADYTARNMEFTDDGKASFDAEQRGTPLGRITLSIPGMHNAVNALGALAAAMEMDVPFKAAQRACAQFAGVKRRFEVMGRERGVTVIDDYAHHPGEIRATLDAARRSGFKRIVAVFQPHLFTRTRDFMDDFAASLSKADAVVVTDIYKAREEPIPGVSAAAIVEKIRALGHADASYIARKEDIPQSIAAKVSRDAAVVFMGAGDITEIAPRLVEVLRHG
jgi:UDP-N-acetylmuramate--alanine ligase